MPEKKKIKINADPADPAGAAKPDTESPAIQNEIPLEKNAADEDTPTADNPVKDLEGKLKSKEEEARQTYDRLLRVSAEFENYKKRSARELEDFRKFANQSLLKEMLSVADNLELAVNSADGRKDIDKNLVDGLHMTLREILRVFEKFNVRPIEAKGKPFDPAFHEAVMREETDAYPENTVINQLQKGYMIHDRLLRPAMVVVAMPKKGKTHKAAKHPKK